MRHDVSDFAHWKEAYDDFDATRRSLGVTRAGVYQEDGNPTNVTVYHHFDSIKAAKAFAASTELRETMQKAGVAGEPTIWFANPAS